MLKDISNVEILLIRFVCCVNCYFILTKIYVKKGSIIMADILRSIFEIINNTPFWVWVVLVILIKRGMSLINDSPASIGRSLIMPFIFVIWGLNTVVNKFASPNTLLSFYLAALILGFLFSYLLYMRRSFYVEDGQLIQEGSALPLVIMLTNFLVKYILNVILAIHPVLYTQMNFNIFYGIVSGFTVGLFFGGIYKTLTAKKEFLKS